MTKCNLCKSDAISQHIVKDIITYRGSELKVKFDYSICNTCGREFVATSQIKTNDLRVIDLKRIADNLLTPKEVSDARNKLQLSQKKAARIFGGGPNAFSKYERGEVSQSRSLDNLLRLCVRHPQLIDDLTQMRP